jgi:hypothetical protein
MIRIRFLVVVRSVKMVVKQGNWAKTVWKLWALDDIAIVRICVTGTHLHLFGVISARVEGRGLHITYMEIQN